MKATVLYQKDTGQVLAAVTRVASVDAAPAADPEAVAPEVLALAGAAVPMRGFANAGTSAGSPDGATFAIPAEQLAALTVEVDPDQLLALRKFTVLDGKKLEVPPATALPTVTATSNRLDVSLAAATALELPLAVHLLPQAGAGGRPLQLQGVFQPGTASAQTVSFNLGAALHGSYAVLVLVRGYRPGMRRFTL